TIGERWTFDELEHKRWRVVKRVDRVNRCDVWMIQRREQARFPLEAASSRCIVPDVGADDLDRDVAFEREIAGTKDFAHPAFAQKRQDLERPEPAAGEFPGHDAHILVPARPCAISIRSNPADAWMWCRPLGRPH